MPFKKTRKVKLHFKNKNRKTKHSQKRITIRSKRRRHNNRRKRKTQRGAGQTGKPKKEKKESDKKKAPARQIKTRSSRYLRGPPPTDEGAVGVQRRARERQDICAALKTVMPWTQRPESPAGVEGTTAAVSQRLADEAAAAEAEAAAPKRPSPARSTSKPLARNRPPAGLPPPRKYSGKDADYLMHRFDVSNEEIVRVG
jgi:hypothetical protein